MRRSFVSLAVALVAAACVPSPTNDAASPHPAAAQTASSPLSEPQFVARFDKTAGELPEGLFVDADAAFVGFAPSSRIVRISLATGATAPFGQLPAPVPGKGFMTGLAQSSTGDIYAGLASFVPEVQAGIYRMGKEGGAAALFAKDASLPFPNALAFDADGALFVTDSGTGSIFRIDSAGRAERWASGDLLTGKKYTCGAGLGPGFDIGANGIVVERDAIYVVNTDKATLIKLPRDTAGKAGVASVIAGPDCVQLGGADGLARAPDGSFVVAINRQDKVARVSATGRVTTIASGAPFDFPASLAYRGASLYVTNFALFNASSGKPAAPGLLKLAN
jgi:sugar lactone lactonase YvrE